MKGITNAELREKLEHIEDELESLKNVKKPSEKGSFNGSFLGISTICALSATIGYVLTEHPVLLFFLVSGILSMILFVVKMAMDNKTK